MPAVVAKGFRDFAFKVSWAIAFKGLNSQSSRSSVKFTLDLFVDASGYFCHHASEEHKTITCLS